MNYAQVKKLDEESQKNLQEGAGPVDQCLCNLLSPPDKPKGIRASIKKAFSVFGMQKKNREAGARLPGATGEKSIKIPLTFTKGKNGIYSTKEVVKRESSCGKCGCDNDKVVLKHSYANIRITSPDVSSICPCPTDCLPDKAKLENNIKVTIERADILNVKPEDSESSLSEEEDRISIPEPVMERRPANELLENVWRVGESDWSGGKID